MIKAQELINILIEEKLNFITGVPCSLFGDFLHHLNYHPKVLTHITATDEGAAMDLAVGYHLATNKVPVIYMQNSGLGVSIDPLTSMMDPMVFGIPAILFITWRGQPGINDEVHHNKIGSILLELLKTLGIEYEFAEDDKDLLKKKLHALKNRTQKLQKPIALILKKGLIEKNACLCEISKPTTMSSDMIREEAIRILLKKIDNNIIVSNLGKTSREIFELRESQNQSHEQDFLVVGSMGSASTIGLSIAINTKKKIYIFDGDGSVLMKMGTLALIGHYKPKNFVHIVFDNGQYESTGNQPNVSNTIKWDLLFKSLGYKDIFIFHTKKEVSTFNLNNLNNLSAIIIKIQVGSRKSLGRPTIQPKENKKLFMKFLSSAN